MIVYTPLPTSTVCALQSGAPDSHGQTPERAVTAGSGTPCRHCLKNVPWNWRAGRPKPRHVTRWRAACQN
jgi:hypothetical protein